MNTKNYDDNYNNDYQGEDYPGEDYQGKDYPGEEDYQGDYSDYGDGSVSGQSNYKEPLFEDLDCIGCFAVFTGVTQFVIGIVSMAVGGVIIGEIGVGYFMYRYNVGVPMIAGFCYCIAGLVGMCICNCDFGTSVMTKRKKRLLYAYMCISFIAVLIGIGHAVEEATFANFYRLCVDCFHMKGLFIASAMIGAGEAVAAGLAFILGLTICCGKFGDMAEEPSHKVVTISDNEFEDYGRGGGYGTNTQQDDDAFAYV